MRGLVHDLAAAVHAEMPVVRRILLPCSASTVRELGQRHIGDLGRAGCIRELLAADAALPVFDAAGSRAGRLDTVMTLRRMRFLFNHAGFGVVTAGAGVLLCAGRRAGGIRHSLPFTERVVRLGIFRVNGTANSAFFPVLCTVMLADEGVVRLFAIFSLADIANGLCLAGNGSTAVRGLVQHCFAGRADVPVVGAVAGPYIRTSMTSCRNYRILLRNLRFARCIREQLFADGAGPICYIAIFRAGGSFCFGLSQLMRDFFHALSRCR